ncbi:unnamed protein product, partial [Coregonus sp. 'balchen']
RLFDDSPKAPAGSWPFDDRSFGLFLCKLVPFLQERFCWHHCPQPVCPERRQFYRDAKDWWLMSVLVLFCSSICVVLSTGMPRTGGCLGSISVFRWRVPAVFYTLMTCEMLHHRNGSLRIALSEHLKQFLLVLDYFIINLATSTPCSHPHTLRRQQEVQTLQSCLCCWCDSSSLVNSTVPLNLNGTSLQSLITPPPDHQTLINSMVPLNLNGTSLQSKNPDQQYGAFLKSHTSFFPSAFPLSISLPPDLFTFLLLPDLFTVYGTLPPDLFPVYCP